MAEWLWKGLGWDGTVSLAALSGCLLLGLGVTWAGEPRGVDTALIDEAERHPHVAAVAEAYSLVMPYLAIAALLVALVLLALAGEWPAALAVAAAFVLADLPQSSLKELFERPRPASSWLPTHSYPSGHATSAAFHWGLVFLVAIPNLLGSHRALGRHVATWLVLATLGAMARVAEGHHWPTDVLGGFLLGTALCLGLARLSRIPWHRRALRRAPATPGAPTSR